MQKLKRSSSYERRGAGVQGWEELLDSMIASGSTVLAVGTFGTDQLLCPDFNIPRFYLAPGRTLRYHLWGDIVCAAGAVGGIYFKTKWGGLASTVLLGSTSLLGLQSSFTAAWSMSGTLTCRSTGTGGSMVHSGIVQLAPRLAAETIPALMTSSVSPNFGALFPNAPVVVDTTVDKLLTFACQFSVNSGNSITCHQRLIEALN